MRAERFIGRASTRRQFAAVAVSVALGLASLTATAFASSGVTVTTNPSVGRSILVDGRGMTLYRYTEDQGSTSVCYGSCAVAWPPVIVDTVPAVDNTALGQGLGTTGRNDGTTQLTYLGQPLYYYVGDSKAGDTSGDASDGVWFVVDGPAA
jgi:predicted lipoprotein with Yx(FWY)xxD motif